MNKTRIKTNAQITRKEIILEYRVDAEGTRVQAWSRSGEVLVRLHRFMSSVVHVSRLADVLALEDPPRRTRSSTTSGRAAALIHAK